MSEDEADWICSEADHLDNGLGIVVCLPGGRCWFAHASLPRDAFALLAPTQAFIFAAEAFTAVVASMAFANLLQGPYLLWEVNEPAKSALIKGHTGSEILNRLIGGFWEAAALTSASPWLARVPSKDNVADAVSRRDFATMEALGATESPLPTLWWPALRRFLSQGVRDKACDERLLRDLCAWRSS